jgi:hypothetical protein
MNDDVTKVLDKAMSDPAFLTRLLAAPKQTVAELGIVLSDEEAATIQAMSLDDMKTFAAEHRSATDPGRRRAAC